jgi:hypothetical protein
MKELDIKIKKESFRKNLIFYYSINYSNKKEDNKLIRIIKIFN